MKSQIVVSTFWAMFLVIGTVASPIIVAIINKIADVILYHDRLKQERYAGYMNRKRELFDSYLRQLAMNEKDEGRVYDKPLVEAYYALIPYLTPREANIFQVYTLKSANHEKPSKSDTQLFNEIILIIKQSLNPQQYKYK